MVLQSGDWVQTESGLKGQVIHVSRLSAFVEVQSADGAQVQPFLLSQLSKIDAPAFSRRSDHACIQVS